MLRSFSSRHVREFLDPPTRFFAAHLFVAFPDCFRGCSTTVCNLQMTSSDSLKSLPLIKEEDNDPRRCSSSVFLGV